MAVNHHDPGINKRTVSTSLFEKIKIVSVTTAAVHIRSWSIYMTESWSQFSYWKTFLFFWLPGFQSRIFALALFFLPRSVSFVQCVLITSVFIGLLQPNLATLAELRSHSCEVPVVFMKVASLVCALICLLLKMQTLLILPGSSLLAPEYPRGSGLVTACVIFQVIDQINVHRGSWGPCGGPGKNKKKVDVCPMTV